MALDIMRRRPPSRARGMLRGPTLLTALLLLACSSDDTRAAGGGTGDDATDQGDGASSADGASSGDGANGGVDGAGGDFDECTAARFDAETGRRATNVVWVIDSSRSMTEEATLVQDNMNRFVGAITAAGLEDYRVVVVSSSAYITVPPPLGSDAAHFLMLEEDVGSHEPLDDLEARFDDYGAFLLPDVITHFVVVTDDDSEESAAAFASAMGDALPQGFRLHAIASPPDAPPASDRDLGCAGPNGDAAAPGSVYYEAAEASDGLTFSICTADWSGLFDTLASEVVSAAPLPCSAAIPPPPEGETLDPNLVNVLYTSPAGDESTWPRVSSESECGSHAAWYYDDPAAPTHVELCPAACTATTGGGELAIALGCSSAVL